MNGYEKDTQFVKALCDFLGKPPSTVARDAGLAATTLTRPYNGTAKTRLSQPIKDRLRERYPEFFAENAPGSLADEQPALVALSVQLPSVRFLENMFAGALETAGRPELVDELAPQLALLLPGGLARAQAAQSDVATAGGENFLGEAPPPPSKNRRGRQPQPGK